MSLPASEVMQMRMDGIPVAWVAKVFGVTRTAVYAKIKRTELAIAAAFRVNSPRTHSLPAITVSECKAPSPIPPHRTEPMRSVVNETDSDENENAIRWCGGTGVELTPDRVAQMDGCLHESVSSVQVAPEQVYGRVAKRKRPACSGAA